jgi:hypothetical protein
MLPPSSAVVLYATRSELKANGYLSLFKLISLLMKLVNKRKPKIKEEVDSQNNTFLFTLIGARRKPLCSFPS